GGPRRHAHAPGATLDPLSLVGWGSERAGVTAPRSLAELRALLGEPAAGVPTLEAFIAWIRGAERPDRVSLLDHLAGLPGDPGVFATWHAYRGGRREGRVARAWRALERPEALAAPMLTAHLLTLRLAAAERREWTVGGVRVDLYAALGDLTAGLLRHAAPAWVPAERAPSEDGQLPSLPAVGRGLADHEPAILRLCRSAVAQIGARELSAGELVWLTWRLYAWFVMVVGVAQDTWAALARPLGELDAFASQIPGLDDALDPTRIRSGGLEVRALCVLYGLYVGEAFGDGPAPRELFSTRLVDALVRLTEAPTAGSPTSTALAWDFPFEVADASFAVLALVHPDALASAPVDAQLRWVERARRVSGRELQVMEGAILRLTPAAADDVLRAIGALVGGRPHGDPFAWEASLLLATRGHLVGDLADRVAVALRAADVRSRVVRQLLRLAAIHGPEAVALAAAGLRGELIAIGASTEPIHAALAALLRFGDPQVEAPVREAVGVLRGLPGLSEEEPFARVLERV
ncbi:MAG TPA: hypothetical protein PKA64_14405, partial [Myxococcota bacterium]|nr:hypothetical protein [Myxococcota bacterium]